jgi:hypothetical protein
MMELYVHKGINVCMNARLHSWGEGGYLNEFYEFYLHNHGVLSYFQKSKFDFVSLSGAG